MKNFSDLTEQELLALAIALEEEEDSRTYSDLADAMREMRYLLGSCFPVAIVSATISRLLNSASPTAIWPGGPSRSF